MMRVYLSVNLLLYSALPSAGSAEEYNVSMGELLQGEVKRSQHRLNVWHATQFSGDAPTQFSPTRAERLCSTVFWRPGAPNSGLGRHWNLAPTKTLQLAATFVERFHVSCSH